MQNKSLETRVTNHKKAPHKGLFSLGILVAGLTLTLQSYADTQFTTKSNYRKPRIIREYDLTGNLTTETFDYNRDGKPDKIIRYEHNSNGNLTTETKDYNCDGIPDKIIRFEYDSDGHLTKRIYDSNCDGIPDKIKRYEHDSNGNLIILTNPQ